MRLLLRWRRPLVRNQERRDVYGDSCFSPGLSRSRSDGSKGVEQPREAMRKQIDTEQESQCPAADVRESEQDEQAGENTESAGQQHQPPCRALSCETQDA